MQLIITEVTEMRGNMYCVAGWCAAVNRMIRPLPNGSNWPTQLLELHGVVPGAVLSVVQSGNPSNGAYPHFTEDTPIDPLQIKLLSPGPAAWFGANAPPTASQLASAFQGNLQRNSVWNGCIQGAHVPLGTQCRSLWGLSCGRRSLNFIEDDYKGSVKLRGQLHDGAALYKLPVSSKALNEAWKAGGLAAVRGSLPNEGRLHVRVGLARAFDGQPNKCFVMINGVHW
jgi:hypothetical protein